MSGKAVFPILLVAALGLQCSREAPPDATQQQGVNSTHRNHAKPAPPSDVVRVSDTARELLGIEVEEAKRRGCRAVLKAMGKVLAPQPQTAIVSHAFPARVAAVHVKVGDSVEKGQALVTLESGEVGTAKSEFFKAIADRELAKLTLEREQRLLGNGIGVKKNFLAAETSYKIAQANAEAAEKTLHVLGFTEEQVEEIADTHQINPSITLHSPIAGKVVSNRAVLGALFDQLTEILTIIDTTLLWVDAGIYEKDIARVRIGQDAEVTVPAYPGKVFTGKVSYIGDMVNEETRTITVRAEVDNEQFLLKPGMFADVSILLNGGCQVLMVPTVAVLEEGNRKLVFVKQQDFFRCREVETGVLDGDHRQIAKGLQSGEEVAVEGNHELYSKLKEEILHRAHHVH